MEWRPLSLSDYLRAQATQRDALCGDMLDWHARASGIVIPHIRAQQSACVRVCVCACVRARGARRARLRPGGVTARARAGADEACTVLPAHARISSLLKFYEAIGTLMSVQLRSLLIASRDAVGEFFARFSERAQRAALAAAVPAAAAHMPAAPEEGALPRPACGAVDRALYADSVTSRRRPAIVLNLLLVDVSGKPITAPAAGAAGGEDTMMATTPMGTAAPAARSIQDAALALTPRAEDIVGAVEGILASVADAFSTVQRIEANVSHAGVALPENKRALSGLRGRDLPVSDTMAGVAAVIRTNWVDACATMHLLDPFTYLLSSDAATTAVLSSSSPPLPDAAALIARYRASIAAVRATVPDAVPMDLFLVDLTGAKSALVARANDLEGAVLDTVAGDMHGRAGSLVRTLKTVTAKLLTVPSTSDALREAEEYLATVREVESRAVDKGTMYCRAQLSFLFEYCYTVMPAHLRGLQEMFWCVRGGRLRARRGVSHADRSLSLAGARTSWTA